MLAAITLRRMVVEHYNLMGVAKVALECTVRYLGRVRPFAPALSHGVSASIRFRRFRLEGHIVVGRGDANSPILAGLTKSGPMLI
jgi:hypothetical protein